MDTAVKEGKLELLRLIKKEGYFKRLLKYNKPTILVIVGIIAAAVQGMMFPIFGILYANCAFALFEDDKEKTKLYCVLMLINAAVSMLATYCQKVSFGIIGEHMTKEIRKELYDSILKKHVGWFDLKENNIGSLTSTLSSDIYLLNGASTEALGTRIEQFMGLAGGLALAFAFDWRVALYGVVFTPILVIASFLQIILMTGYTEVDDSQLKDANLLISDAIINYKTASSFANEGLLVSNLRDRLEKPRKAGVCKSQINL